MDDGPRAGGGLRLRRRDAPATAGPPLTRPLTTGPAAPQQLHRGMTLIATISLFIGTRDAWTRAMTSRPPVAGIISVCYAGILVAGVLALTTRTRRALTRVDAGVLVLAVVLVLCGYWLNHAGTDEGVLTAQAANQILHGHPVYGQPWPWLFDSSSVGITKTMAGSADYTYGYPPLTALLAAPVHAVIHSTAAATLVTTGALLAGAVLLWLLLPAPWRSAATAVCLGFGFLPGYAYSGYPAVLALVLLIPVVVRWPDTGTGGRLGLPGVLQALCLGAACATQQLAWFLTPFLLVGLYAVRRGDLGPRLALGVVARYTGTAALTWAAINAYFAAEDFSSWLHGLLLPITQKAILHGQGLMGISYYFTAGSRHLDYYSYGSLLLLFGLLAATLLFVRRLGPAITVLPWLSFYLATRSQDGYFLMMTPLWLAAAATVPASALASAWQPRIPRLTARPARAVLAAGLLAPAVVCVTIAAASPPPLRMNVTADIVERSGHRDITQLVARVVNTTATRLTPHFASRLGQGASDWWTASGGPESLAPHASATYVVKPPGGLRRVPGGSHPRFFLIAVTGTPMTITSARIPTS
ncbi:hypothetical protein [Streptomyces sp. MBT53]|uniref:hypothetical protein n=1 Tax=Streptomyces sp. MBT53 TaxID=1488384 RepID=UPI001913859C|nr:hypothetical protein [Streptomyces sp. MBT53]MBK6010226.1 hypothetical protein [Streptomyces sp. MBT53]